MHGNSFAQCTGWPRSGEEVVFLCKFAQPCIGGEIPNDESSPYKIPVGESSVISVISNERGEHSRLVSTSCLLVKTLGKLCSSCCYAMTLFINRNQIQPVLH